MKILADSNILVDFWKKPTEDMSQIFKREDIFVCGVVRAELLWGAVSDRNFRKLRETLDDFQYVGMKAEDWDLLGKNLYLLGTHGITVPLADVLISTIAINHDLTVWTNDKHFRLIQSVLHGLKLLKVSEET